MKAEKLLELNWQEPIRAPVAAPLVGLQFVFFRWLTNLQVKLIL